MAGGIFVDQPFHPNLKCIIISILLIILHIILPKWNPLVMLLIFIVSYIAIAWYDHLYNCDNKLYSGTFPFSMNTLDAWGKPQRRDEKDKKNLVKDQERTYKRNINLFHILFIMPLFIYIGIRRTNAGSDIMTGFLILGIIALLYHSMRIFVPRDIGSNNNKKKELFRLKIIYFIHVFAIAPLMIYTGYSSDPRTFTPLLMLGISGALYHGYRYITL